VKTRIATVALVSVVAGAGFVGLRTLGESAKETFDELNRTFERNAPGTGKASSQDAAAWIERYSAGAKHASCRAGQDGWDYVCVFRDGAGRRRKVGVVVGSKQPTQMSPLVAPRQRLPKPAA
jgi:hypothetical protein